MDVSGSVEMSNLSLAWKRSDEYRHAAAYVMQFHAARPKMISKAVAGEIVGKPRLQPTAPPSVFWVQVTTGGLGHFDSCV